MRCLGGDLEGYDINGTAASVAENKAIPDLLRIKMLHCGSCWTTDSTDPEELCFASPKMLNGKI